MAVSYGAFEQPEEIKVEAASPTFARFVVEPFERGVGHTTGNSLRRIMLSSLEAPAVISVKIEGVSHEYVAIEGVIEDMINIVLNIKKALFRQLPSSEDRLSHEARVLSKMLEITAEDLKKGGGQVHVKLADVVDSGSGYEICNPDLHLFTVTKPMTRLVQFRVGLGRGFVPSERHAAWDKTADEIVIDSAFSPVRLVNYFVENTRVGQDTDFDRLILEVTTDGRMSPQEALSFAAQLGIKQLSIFTTVDQNQLSFDREEEASDGGYENMMYKLGLRIDEIELSVRSTNCLSSAGINTIAELVVRPESEMLKYRNFGKKSLNEIKAKLHEMGLHLGMDLSSYGITRENVSELVPVSPQEDDDETVEN